MILSMVIIDFINSYFFFEQFIFNFSITRVLSPCITLCFYEKNRLQNKMCVEYKKKMLQKRR